MLFIDETLTIDAAGREISKIEPMREVRVTITMSEQTPRIHLRIPRQLVNEVQHIVEVGF